jgi:type I restriction enzyme M protein
MERVPKAKQSSTAPTNDGATVGYEARLWQMADALRGSMDAAEYKHVVLGLIFLKYISDAFEAQHAQLEAEQAQGADPEDTRTSTARSTSSGCHRRRAGRT